LSPEASENLRSQMVDELEQLKNSEALANWAHRTLPLKNHLSTADALAVEDAFSAKLSQLGEFGQAAPRDSQANGHGDEPLQTVTVIKKPIRERDREHEAQ
jgi:hypothetical protein